MTRFVDAHRERFGGAPICRALGWASLTCSADKQRPPSDGALRDADLGHLHTAGTP